MLRRILGPVVVTALVAATGVLGAPASPAVAVPRTAAAAACSSADGVTAVVDFNELGGGVTAACDPAGAGKAAAQLFPDVGYELTYAQEGSGFVCRVSGKPADDPCVRTPPATAYWSLWWSDGKSEEWVYSTDGVASLTVPDGGYVALAWHQGSGDASPPDVVPSAHETASPSPSGGGSGGSGHHSGGSHTTPSTPQGSTSVAPTETTSPSASESTTAGAEHKRKHHAAEPERDHKPRHRRTDEASPTDAPSSALPEAAELTSGPPAGDVDDDADDGSGFPTWVGVAIAVLVIGAAASVPLLRRRAG